MSCPDNLSYCLRHAQVDPPSHSLTFVIVLPVMGWMVCSHPNPQNPGAWPHQEQHPPQGSSLLCGCVWACDHCRLHARTVFPVCTVIMWGPPLILRLTPRSGDLQGRV